MQTNLRYATWKEITFTEVEEVAQPVTIDLQGATKLVIAHEMIGEGAAGRVALAMKVDADTNVPHHGAGTNIPSVDETASYSCTFEDCSKEVILTPTFTTGTHKVYWMSLV